MNRNEHIEYNKRIWQEIEKSKEYQDNFSGIKYEGTLDLINRCKRVFIEGIKDSTKTMKKRVKLLKDYLEMEEEDGWIPGSTIDYFVGVFTAINNDKENRLREDGLIK